MKAIWDFLGSPLASRILSVIACLYLAIATLGYTKSYCWALFVAWMFILVWTLGNNSAKKGKS